MADAQNTIYMQQKVTHQEVIDLYKQLKICLPVAKQLGISRERVRQIVNKFGDAETAAIHKKKRVLNYTACCLECKRPWSQEVKHGGNGFCIACKSMFQKRKQGKGTKKNYFRTIFYPTNCLNPDCQKPIPKGSKRTRGYCQTCYDRLVTHKTEKFRVSQKRYKQRHREQINARFRKYWQTYYLKNKDRLMAYWRKYRQEHSEKERERWRRAAKKRYWRLKAERELRQPICE